MAADTYTVERSVTIAAPADAVHPLVADFHRWTAWSPWEDLDPDMTRTYGGAESGAGATYAWSGNRRAGRGTMRITESLAPTLVEVDLTFEKPFPSRSTSTFTFTPQSGETSVTWRLVGPRPLPMRLLGRLVSMDKLLGKDFEKGLARLKTVAEESPT